MNKVSKEFNTEENMDTIAENKKGILVWIKLHRKELFLAGISITTIVGIILGIKNEEVLVELWELLAESIRKIPKANITSASTEQSSVLALEPTVFVRKKYSPLKEGFDVKGHIRTMEAGRYHSPEKAIEAAKLGIELLPNQTLVSSYKKCVA